MSGDNRTVATDALATLGTVLTGKADRDAIHLAVEPVVAAVDLEPGDHVGFVNGGVGYCDNTVGIVDPFLPGTVEAGDRFWLVVYPRQITSLRHVWEHPNFPNSEVVVSTENREESKKWLYNYVEGLDFEMTYDELLALARGEEVGSFHNDEHGHIHCQGHDASGTIPDEVWLHVQIVTGKPVERKFQAAYFSCGC